MPNTLKLAARKRRKHRLVLTVTFSHPMTASRAVQATNLKLEWIDLAAAPVWASNPSVYVNKIRASKKSW